MKEGILKCPQILHLIYNDFIQMSLIWFQLKKILMK